MSENQDSKFRNFLSASFAIIDRFISNRTVRNLLRFVAIVAVVALWTAASDLFAAENGAVLAMGVAVGAAGVGRHINDPLTTATSNELAPGLLRSEVDERIVKIRPSATPIDQISRLGGARAAGSIEVDYYSVDTKAGSDKVDVRLEMDAGATDIELTMEHAALFSPTETLLAPGLTDTDGNTCIFYVKEVSGSKLKLKLMNPGSFEEILKGQVLVRMGRAAKELDVQTPLYASVPTKQRNYCQIFKIQVEQSSLQRLADKEVGWTFSDQEEVAVMDMRMGMEKSFLFGLKGRMHDTDNNDVWFTQGIWNQTDNDCKYTGDSFTQSDFYRLMRQAFTGNAGSTRKVLVAGSDLIDAINRFPLSRDLTGTQKETVWGVDFHTMISKFGTLYVVHSEVFDDCGGSYNGMVIDPEYLTKYTHIPFSAERLSLRESGLRNTEAVVMTEASCLVLRYPTAHVRVIKN